jgi:hypothetical protein
MTRTDTLNRLEPLYLARHDTFGAPSPCLEGTRTEILDNIMEWARSPTTTPVLWLDGIAGSGKTTIAQTITSILKQETRLGGAFFITRDPERRDIQRIVPTLAHELASLHPTMMKHMVDSVASFSNPSLRHVGQQIERLLVEPLRKSHPSHSPLVFVVDGINDCQKLDASAGGSLLSLLLSAISKMDKVKILLSTSQENNIGHILKSFTGVTTRHSLHQLPVGLTKQDIQTYYLHHFKEISNQTLLGDVDHTWWTEEDLRFLVSHTGPLFIFAATAVKFICRPRHTPGPRLSRLIDWLKQSGEHAGGLDFGLLHALYAVILQDAISSEKEVEDDELRQRVYKLLAMITFSVDPKGISITALATLGSFDIIELRADLMALSSVVSSSVTTRIGFYHPSFVDFLCSERCQYPIRPDEGRAQMANGCLRVINANLSRQSICPVDDELLLNRDVANLSARVDDFIPSGLHYACVYLMRHLSDAEVLFDPNVQQGLETFCHGNVIRWIEILSFLGAISISMENLYRVALRIEVSYFKWVTEQIWLIIYKAIWYTYRKQGITSAATRTFNRLGS